ncbi:MAG TPA: RHS repeat-associated core domain-containing protein, partial [Gammaproteobacteria bacterium]|nr:RHS repeat-associated core domain-containing protein [Gammaproteobacteria bacterium]
TQQIEINGGAAETTTYGYDNNDRLTQVTYPDQTTTYTYDDAYNRRTERTTAGASLTENKTYSYNNRNQVTGITDSVSGEVIGYTYDANGNRIQKTVIASGATQSTDFVYDVRDQLREILSGGSSIGQFLYDYQGLRVRKQTAAETARYVYDDQSVLLQTDDAGNTLSKYDYGPDHLLSLNNVTEGTQFYLFDALGSVTNLIKPGGAIQARYQYDAWGTIRNKVGDSENVFGFTGHEMDTESGLIYMKARFYDPDLGQFLSQDLFEGATDTPPSLHKYLYAYENPTVYTDPDGNETKTYKYVDENGVTNYSQTPPPVSQEDIERNSDENQQLLDQEPTEDPIELSKQQLREEQKRRSEVVEDEHGVGTKGGVSPDCGEDVACEVNAETEKYSAGPARRFAEGASKGADVVDVVVTPDETTAIMIVAPEAGVIAKGKKVKRALNAADEINDVRKAGKVETKINNAIESSTAKSWKQTTVLDRTVYKNDNLIDPLKMDKEGRTNVQRMKNGLAPIGPDGESVELHHTVQQEYMGFSGQRGPLAEVSADFHNDNYNAIHIYRKNDPDYISWRKLHPDQAREYDAYRRAYWVERAKDFEK